MSAERDAMLVDPFGELQPPRHRRTLQLLGACIELESNSGALIRIADDAFGGLPPHHFAPRGSAPKIRLALRVRGATNRGDAGQAKRQTARAARQNTSARRAPSLRLSSGAGLLTAALGDAGTAMLAPDLSTGLVLVERELLRDPYHLRYELLEFALYTLAARAGGLAPLHAACVGARGHGALILGGSGAGKSTLAAQCLLDGFQFVAEDSVFLSPSTLGATGLASFLHLRAESLRLLTTSAGRFPARRARSIVRRSGIEKLEIDLRCGRFSLAPQPLPISALIFVSAAPAQDQDLLVPIKHVTARERFAATQPYASAQRGWPALLRRIARVPAYELRRGSTPRAGSDALRRLLECTSR